MVEPSQLRVSPYARISETDDERAPGIDRQLKDAHGLIGLRGGVATEDYIDNDTSAYKPEVIREEGFEPWLKAFKENLTDGIAGYDLDRIARQPSDLERIIRAYDEAATQGRQTAFWTIQGSIDLSTADGRTMARVLVAFANKASMDTARRLASFYKHEAMEGRTYSNYPAFGWDRDGTLNDKAELLRQAVKDVLAGVRPTTIAERWRQQGIQTERGKRWTGEALRRVLIAPRIAGIAVYKAQALKDDEGQYIRGSWGPLVDVATWQELCEMLRPGPRKRPTKSYLGGKARCGTCGARMVRCLRERDNGRYYYQCQSKDSGGCASVTINGNRTDELIRGLVVKMLDGQVAASERKPFPGQARLDQVVKMRAEVGEAYNAGRLPLNDWLTQVAKLEAEEKELRAEAVKYRRRQRGTLMLGEEFLKLPVDKQRAVTDVFIKAVVVAPSGRTGVYDPNRITVVYTD